MIYEGKNLCAKHLSDVGKLFLETSNHLTTLLHLHFIWYCFFFTIFLLSDFFFDDCCGSIQHSIYLILQGSVNGFGFLILIFTKAFTFNLSCHHIIALEMKYSLLFTKRVTSQLLVYLSWLPPAVGVIVVTRAGA